MVGGILILVVRYTEQRAVDMEKNSEDRRWQAFMDGVAFFWRAALGVTIATGVFSILTACGMDRLKAAIGSIGALCANSIYLLMKISDHHSALFYEELNHWRDEWRAKSDEMKSAIQNSRSSTRY
jgi:hypothetical protein